MCVTSSANGSKLLGYKLNMFFMSKEIEHHFLFSHFFNLILSVFMNVP